MLCVFMLFVSYFEYYVLLLNVIEFIVDKFSIFVILEGYILFYDSCVEKFVVIFDLGVIEVNVYFVFDWYILVKNIYVFYVMVKLCWFGIEKFMFDGWYVGIGGGNYVIMGGLILLESLFLKCLDILWSFIIYW